MLFGLFMLAATASVSLPQIGQPVGDMSEWIRDSDYDESEFGVDGGDVVFKVLFAPDGKPDRCSMVSSTGNATVEKKVFTIVAKRFRFKPSLGMDGQPAYLLLERAANFRFRGTRARPYATAAPKWTLGVSRIPNKRERAVVSVIVAVGRAGDLLGCLVPERAPADDQALAQLACKTLPTLWEPMVESDTTGSAVAYLRDIKVEFHLTPP